MDLYKKLIYSKTNGLELVEDSLSELQKNFETQKSNRLLKVQFSCVNYKDALGVTGSSPIFKKDPIVPGIDFVGESLSDGKTYLAQGEGFGESFDGGYSQYQIVDSYKTLELPAGLSPKEAMTLGTAGFTAALALWRFLENGQEASKGPLLISGATGGVGGFALSLFAQRGFEVEVVTHRSEYKDSLLKQGASKVYLYEELFIEDQKIRPLEKARWAGVIDNLGGDFLEKTLPQVNLWGNVASIGLAKGYKFSATVMPFILRGVSLLGISSTNCPMPLRKKIWNHLATDWKPKKLESFIQTQMDLEEVYSYSQKMLANSKAGRALVKINA